MFVLLYEYVCKEDGGAVMSRKKTHEEYVVEVAAINPNIEVVEEYINAKTKILHRCKIDGYEWYAIPYDILCGTGCPNCHMSKGEKIISAWLDEKNILYKSQEIFDGCRDKRVLPFDFYLLDYNILIEYNGKQHYEPIEYFGGEDKLAYITMHDAIKEDYCRNNNISLIVIPYYADIYEELEKMHELFIVKEVA